MIMLKVLLVNIVIVIKMEYRVWDFLYIFRCSLEALYTHFVSSFYELVALLLSCIWIFRVLLQIFSCKVSDGTNFLSTSVGINFIIAWNNLFFNQLSHLPTIRESHKTERQNENMMTRAKHVFCTALKLGIPSHSVQKQYSFSVLVLLSYYNSYKCIVFGCKIV